MNEFWFQIERNDYIDGGECSANNAQEVADYIRQTYEEDVEIISILRVESEWK